jgi:hypothetical protein
VTVCQWFGLKTTGMVFSGSASKPVATIFSGLASKPVATIFSGLASKPVVMVSPSLSFKSVAQVSRFGSQNRQLRFADWASKSPRRFLSLGLKTKWVMVSHLLLKTDGRAMARDTRQDLVACFA